MSTSNVLHQCRLCLKKSPTRVNVFGGDFPKMLEILTSIKIKEGDGLPKYSCTKCAQDVKAALITKKRIIKAHKTLLENLRKRPTIIIVDDTAPLIQFGTEKSSNSSGTANPIEFVSVEAEHISEQLQMNATNLEDKIAQQCEKIKRESQSVEQLGIKTEEIHINDVKDDSLQSVIDSVMKVNKDVKKKVENNISKNHPDSLYCQICKLKLKDRFIAAAHRNKHKLTKCTICARVVRSDNFKKHLQLHDSQPSSCKMCGATCKNSESLRGHIFYQHKSAPDTYVCEECGKKFRTKYKFSLHQRKEHIGIRTFKCQTCGKGFFTNGNLMTHINMTHKKLRPHICEFCGTGFSSAYALKTHKRQHTNEKPFKCEFCKEGFRQKVSLRSHLRSKHGFEEVKQCFCEHCGKGFATSYALSIHLRLHLSEKCDFCSDSFAEKDYLKNHLKDVHNIEMD